MYWNKTKEWDKHAWSSSGELVFLANYIRNTCHDERLADDYS